MLSTATSHFSRPLALRPTEVVWREGEEVPSLRDGDIHVWRIDLAALANDTEGWQILSAAELEAVSRVRDAAHRSRKRAARIGLRRILGKYIECAPRDIRFTLTPFGKPIIDESQNVSNVQFNLSQSSGIALLGLCRDRKIGIDVEWVDTKFPVGNVLRQFSNRGLFVVEDTEQSLGVSSFFRLWTRNEAFAKATGLGLAGLVRQAEDSKSGTSPVASDADGSWSLASFDASAGFVGAVATSFEPTAMLFVNYQDRGLGSRAEKV